MIIRIFTIGIFIVCGMQFLSCKTNRKQNESKFDMPDSSWTDRVEPEQLCSELENWGIQFEENDDWDKKSNDGNIKYFRKIENTECVKGLFKISLFHPCEIILVYNNDKKIRINSKHDEFLEYRCEHIFFNIDFASNYQRINLRTGNDFGEAWVNLRSISLSMIEADSLLRRWGVDPIRLPD